MKRHLNRKKIDPKHVDFWKKLFAAPFVVLLERESSGLTSMGHGNVCILRKQVGSRRLDVCRDCHMITAFYFPLIPGLRLVRLVIGGMACATWTPGGSDFRQPPLPLPAILDECRSLPTREILWERILEGCRSRADYPVIHHDFGRTIEIDGEKYRRAVLVHPCIVMVGNLDDIYLMSSFDEEQEFVFYQESWLIDNESRRYIARNGIDFSIDSDTFFDQSNEGRMASGSLRVRHKHSTTSDLGRLLQNDLGALRKSANYPKVFSRA